MGQSTNLKGRKIASNSLKLSIAQIITMGISMITAMMLSRFRTLEEYGTYSQLLMTSAIIVSFFSAGFAQCINYFIANEEAEEKRSSFIKNYYFIITIAGLIGGLVSLAMLPALEAYFGNELLNKYFFVLLLYPFSKILNNGADRFFIVYNKTNALVLFKLRYSVTSLLVVTLATVFKWSFSLYMVVFIAVELLFALLIYFFIYKVTNVVPFGFDKKVCARILSFALPMGFASLISVINTELDRIVIGGLVDTEKLAVYTNAAKELPITVFVTAISAVVMPHVVKTIQSANKETALKLWRDSVKLTAYIICFCICAFFVFAPQVISVLYSDKYVAGADVFRVYLLVLLFRLTYYGMVLNAVGDTKTILRCTIVSIASNLALDYILYHFVGMTGPAIATVISVGVMNMYQLYKTKKLLKVRFTEIYPVWTIFKILILNAALGAVFWVLQQVMFKYITFNQNLLTVALGLVWFGLYFIIMKNKMISLWKKLNE